MVWCSNDRKALVVVGLSFVVGGQQPWLALTVAYYGTLSKVEQENDNSYVQLELQVSLQSTLCHPFLCSTKMAYPCPGLPS